METKTYNIPVSRNKGLLNPGRPRTQRLLQAHEVLKATGQNPIENLIRLAKKMEKEQDHTGASRNWIEIQSYVEAKRKAIDPMEQDAKRKQAMTIKELEAIRDELLASTSKAIIDVESIEIAEPVRDTHPLLM